MRRGRKDIIISKRKYVSNLKKFWWFVIPIVLLMGALIFYNFKKSEYIAAAAASKVNYFGAQTYVDIAASADTMKSISLYTLAKDSLEELNPKLKAQGYSEISTDDYITCGAYSASCYVVNVYGADNTNGRLGFISKTLAEKAMEIAKSKYKVTNIKINGEPTVFNAKKTNETTYTRTYGELAETTVKSTGKASVRERMITISNGIVLVVGIVGFFAIVLVISIYDRKIYARDEIEQIADCKYLGNLSDSKYRDTIVASITKYLNDNSVKDVAFATIKQEVNNNIKYLIDKMEESNIKSDIIKEVINNPDNVASLNDSVIIAVYSGKDKEKELIQLLEQTEIMGVNPLGYVIV